VAKRPLLRNVLTLSASSLVVRVMGFAYRVLLVRITGAEVVGVFQMSAPLLRLCATVVSLGLPVALSKTIAESLAKRDTVRVKNSFRVSFLFVLVNSLVATVFLLALAGFLSERALPDNRTRLAIIIMPIALVFTCASGIVRGYFHGQRNATPTAIAQVIEQCVRAAVTLGLARRIADAPIEAAAAIIMLAMGVGEGAGFVTLMAYKMRSDRSLEDNRPPDGHQHPSSYGRPDSQTHLPSRRLRLPHLGRLSHAEPYSQAHRPSHISSFDLISGLLAMSLPMTAVGFVHSISNTLDALLIPRRLLVAGFDSSQATLLFGRLSGMAMPVLFLPGLFIFPISTMLLPEVAASTAGSGPNRLGRRLRQIIPATCLLTIASGAAMLLVASPVSVALFGTDEAAGLIRWYAPAVPLLYMGYVLSSVLNGLGRARLVLLSTVTGALADFLVLYATVAMPYINIHGAIIGDMVGSGVVTLINGIALAIHMRGR
jgi:stage V sporulation protein B